MLTRRISLRVQQGVTYVEVLVATVLIAVSLVPALEALQGGVQGAGIHKQYAIDHYALAGKFETMLAQPFSMLESAASAAGDPNTPTSYSDSLISSDGRTLKREVYLAHYDADNADADNDHFTGGEPDLLWLRVEIANTAHALETLVLR